MCVYMYVCICMYGRQPCGSLSACIRCVYVCIYMLRLREEEERANQGRLDAAVAAQQEFWDRMERRKSHGASHIQAIRHARTFAVDYC